jgi:hypothetical protein
LAVVPALWGGSAVADSGKDDSGVVRAQLSGFQEVPVVSTTGIGEFRAKINTQTNEIEYEFCYADMQAPVLQAHIHLGQHSVNGGIMVWLCQTAANPAPAAVADTPVCSSPAFSSIGIITAARIVRPGGAQQLGAGELAELVAALRAGVAYANVHTTDSPGGEIRGQIRPGHRH